MVSFKEPASFVDAQRIAMAVFDEIKPHAVSGSEGNPDGGNEAGFQSARDGFDKEQDRGTTSVRTKTDRPHSSPEARVDTAISHSNSASDVKPGEFLKSRDGQLPSQAIVDCGSHAGKAHPETDSETSSVIQNAVEQQSAVTDEAADEEQWEIYDEAAEDAISTPLGTLSNGEMAQREQENPEPREADAASESAEDIAGVEQDLQVEEVDTEGLEVSSQRSDLTEPIVSSLGQMGTTMSAEEVEDRAEMEVAEVLFDLVDQLAGDFPDDMDVIAPQAPSGDAGSTNASLSASIHIQSAFRGHQARRAFRMALYQEALNCGVLGAMPGSFQGKSGWYQDPKSLMAYYFSILPDTGEWKQKIVIRCSRLILTTYQMHEEILSKVFISP